MKFRFGELFCGPGGLAYGAMNAEINNNNELFNIKHQWASDINEDACETYKQNIEIESGSVFCTDVADLGIKDLPPIDAFAYGFPCNDFSVVGEKNGMEGKYGGLFKYGIDVLNAHQPQWFLAENVGGLQSADEGMAFKIILNELKNAGRGYKLTPHMYKFEEYGVPQTRHRIIIIGIRSDLDIEFRVPAPTTPNIDQMITAKDALENPPIPKDTLNNELTNHPQSVVDRLKSIPPGENAWYDGMPEEHRLSVKGAKLSQIYKRLLPKKPAYTVTGSGGGGTYVYHWSEPRALTNRERARLQTFPDEFEFIGKKLSVRKQIGMAVPPLAAKVIIEAVLKTFAGIEYKNVPSRWEDNGDDKENK